MTASLCCKCGEPFIQGTLQFLQINESWALAADNVQWVLQRHRRGPQAWYGVSFVSSTKDTLARCMRQKGVPADDAKHALDSLPDTFAEWRQSHLELVTGVTAPALAPDIVPAEKAAVTRPVRPA
jgi:hypothetical protein